jgi:hypothetical protein
MAVTQDRQLKSSRSSDAADQQYPAIVLVGAYIDIGIVFYAVKFRKIKPFESQIRGNFYPWCGWDPHGPTFACHYMVL